MTKIQVPKIIQLSRKKIFIVNRDGESLIIRFVNMSATDIYTKSFYVKGSLKIPLDDHLFLVLDSPHLTLYINMYGSVRAIHAEDADVNVIFIKLSDSPFWRFYYFQGLHLINEGYIISSDLVKQGLTLKLEEQEMSEIMRLTAQRKLGIEISP